MYLLISKGEILQVLNKIIKEDNLSDRNEVYLTFCEVDILLSDSCKIEQKAENFYRIKNKEREEKNKKNI